MTLCYDGHTRVAPIVVFVNTRYWINSLEKANSKTVKDNVSDTGLAEVNKLMTSV